MNLKANREGIIGKLIAAAALLLCASSVASADLKITTKNTVAGQSNQSTIYIKGTRQRTEAMLGAQIFQCDLKRLIHTNDRARKYLIMPIESAPEAESAVKPAPVAPGARTRKGGVVTYTITTTDTGERKQFFGYTARHIKTTTVMDAPPGSCNPGRNEIETDGWYIDLQFSFNCATDTPSPVRNQPERPDCRDEIHFKRIGSARLGFPVLLTMKMKVGGMDDDAAAREQMSQMMSTVMEVVEISNATLDPALFDIPAGYAQAASMQELYSPGAAMGAMTRPPVSIPDLETHRHPPAIESKRPGVIRVGVVGLNNRTGKGIAADQARERLISSLSTGEVEAVQLLQTLPTEVAAEAKQKECDFILYTDITDLKQSTAGKVGGMLGRATGINTGKDSFEARIEFRLLTTAGERRLESSATAKEQDAYSSVGAAVDREAKAVLPAVRRSQ